MTKKNQSMSLVPQRMNYLEPDDRLGDLDNVLAGAKVLPPESQGYEGAQRVKN